MQGVKLDADLRLLAKRSALALGNMNFKSREVIRDSFASIDFYDADLVLVLK